MFGSENVKLLSRFSCPFTPKQVRKNKRQLVAQHGDYSGFSSSSIPAWMLFELGDICSQLYMYVINFQKGRGTTLILRTLL